jgi:hypothetical protein
MKWIACLILSLAACGLVFLGLADDPPIPVPAPSPTEPTESPSEASPCLTAVSIGLTATPSKIALGQSSALSWSVEGADGCAELQVRLNGEVVPISGSRTVCPTRTATYTIVVTETRNGVVRQKSASTQVEFIGIPPHIVIDRNTCHPAQVLITALVDSTNDEQTVELSCGVDIDLTGRSIDITRDHRSLIASPGCERGPRHRNEDVPRIFVKDAQPRNAPLFSIHSDYVFFAGFRLEGPTSGIGGDDYKEKGIVVSPADCTPSETTEDLFECAIHNIEFSNMEIYYWSGAGIEVDDNATIQDRGRFFNTYWVDTQHDNHIVGAAHIKNNYFHENRHDHGEGYGVDVSEGAYALIEQNVFEANRHAIAGGSKNCGGKGLDYSGYTARDNLILPGGGSHCNPDICNWAIVGLGILPGVACHVFDLECYHTHQIDMHGDKNQGPNLGCGKDVCDHPAVAQGVFGFLGWLINGTYGTPQPSVNCHNWLCGTAGETIIIERNTILYTGGSTPADVGRGFWGFLVGMVNATYGTPGPYFSWSTGYAINIRGSPADKAVVDGNVFKHKNSSLAIHQGGTCDGKINRIDLRSNNQFDQDPTTMLGTGDFVGDGQQDKFMATGVTWWARSPVTSQWRYLNTMPQRLSELNLRDADGDAVCDVVPKTRGPHELPVYSKSGTSPWVPLHVVVP